MRYVAVATAIILLGSISLVAVLPDKADADTGDSSLSFVITTDNHFGNKDPATTLEGILDDINSLTSLGKLDFIFDGGDFTQDYSDYLDEWHNAWTENAPIPVFPIFGNHDIVDYHPDGTNNNPYRLLHQALNESDAELPNYAFMKDGILFIIVGDIGRHYDITVMQREWIEFLTQKYHNTTTVLFSHVPIRNTTSLNDGVTSGDSHYRELNNDTWWHNLLESNPQINLAVSEHNHGYVGGTASGGLNGGAGTTQIYYANQNGANCVCVLVPASWYDSSKACFYFDIDSASITVKAWDYSTNSWSWEPSSYSISTTYDVNSQDWYSFPIFFEDNQTKTIANRILSKYITLQMVGQDETEMFENANLDYYSNETIDGHAYYPWWVYFSHDNDIGATPLHGSNSLMYGQMDIPSSSYVSFPFKTATGVNSWDTRSTHLQYSQGGYPSVCGIHVFGYPPPDAEYAITIKCRAVGAATTFDYSMNVTAQNDVYSTLANSGQTLFSSQSVGTSWTVFTANYTQLSSITDDNVNGVGFLQGKLTNTGGNELEIAEFSIKRRTTEEHTQNFHIKINDDWYNQTGTLADFETYNFTVPPSSLSDTNGDIVIHAEIGGNKRGWTRIIYKPPVLFCRNAKFNLRSVDGNKYDLHAFSIASSHYCKFTRFLDECTNLSIDNGNVNTSTNGYYKYTSTHMSDVYANITYGNSDSSSIASDTESFGYFYTILYTAPSSPPATASDTESFGYFYKILYSNATANGSGFVIPHSYNYFYIAAGLAVFFPIFGIFMYKWRAR